MAHPAITFREPFTTVVWRGAETEGDDAEKPVQKIPDENKKAAPEESQGETMVIRFDITCGNPPARLDESREVVN